jgi:hypothetical protein
MPRFWLRPFIAAHNDELVARRQGKAFTARATTAKITVNRPLRVFAQSAWPSGAGKSAALVGLVSMRALLAALVVLFCFAGTAQAEWRMFVVANDADDYGIDRCLANHEKCGELAANAYCKSHDYSLASSFRKVDRDDITGAIPSGDTGACRGRKCSIVAIICTR